MKPTPPELPGLAFVQFLGSGGFSDVYLYERDRPRIKVAVKVLKADALDDAQLRQFMSEAEVMAELAEHPFIVPVLGSGTSADGRPFLEMRYFPNADLAERVEKNPMSVADALKTGIQMASAIETAHQANIVHRDIKPSNILMSSYGVPALTDFGIAGRPGELAEDDDNVGVSMPWAPPEVLSGASNGSRASDIYSLAATIWHLLIGRPPFQHPGGDNSERATFARILHSAPPSLGRSDAPSSLDRLLQMAMSKKPEHRPRTALEFARQLQRVEQEMRLARTEIVVLETPEHPSPALPAAPTGLTPQTPLPSAPPSPTQSTPTDAAATSRRPARASTPASHQAESAAATARRPARATPANEPVATTRRPAKVEPAATPRRPPRAEPAATQLRPQSAAPEAVDDEEAARRGLPIRPLVAVVVLIVAITGGGVLLSLGHSKKPAALPPAPAASTADEVLTNQMSGPPVPTVTGTLAGGTATFTWPQDEAGDAYAVTFSDGSTTTTTTPSVSKAASGKLCVKVLAQRQSLSSQGFGQACVGS